MENDQLLPGFIYNEQRRYELTLEAMKQVDEGLGLTHEEVKAWMRKLRAERTKKRDKI